MGEIESAKTVKLKKPHKF